jgi:hypothetical protein
VLTQISPSNLATCSSQPSQAADATPMTPKSACEVNMTAGSSQAVVVGVDDVFSSEEVLMKFLTDHLVSKKLFLNGSVI